METICNRLTLHPPHRRSLCLGALTGRSTVRFTLHPTFIAYEGGDLPTWVITKFVLRCVLKSPFPALSSLCSAVSVRIVRCGADLITQGWFEVHAAKGLGLILTNHWVLSFVVKKISSRRFEPEDKDTCSCFGSEWYVSKLGCLSGQETVEIEFE